MGFNSLIPKSILGRLLVDILEKDGISRMNFQVKEAPFLASNGAYRNILGKYKDLSYKIDENKANFMFFFIKENMQQYS